MKEVKLEKGKYKVSEFKDLNAIYSHIFSEFGEVYVKDLNIFFCRCVLQSAW